MGSPLAFAGRTPDAHEHRVNQGLHEVSDAGQRSGARREHPTDNHSFVRNSRRPLPRESRDALSSNLGAETLTLKATDWDKLVIEGVATRA